MNPARTKSRVLQRKLNMEKLECRRVFAALLGASPSNDGLWNGVPEMVQPQGNQVSYLRATDFGLYTLNTAGLNQALSQAPMEFSQLPAQQQVITVPTPTGQYESFRIFNSPIMEPALAAKFPEIRTYSGQGINDSTSSIRLDFTPQGFHAQVLSPHGAYYVDPFFHMDGSYYASYFGSDVNSPSIQEIVPPADRMGDAGRSSGSGTSGSGSNIRDNGSGRSGLELRSYRLAIAATGEYTGFFGGTVAGGQAAIVTAINRVSGIYETELAIRLVIVANNDLLVYTDAVQDPYTDGNDVAIVDENQTNVDAVIGDANYDIGHVFQLNGAGYAPGNVGVSGQKAGATTGPDGGKPLGDSFWVDYVAHEMGHQFNANHSFNGEDGACGARWAPTAYETGSGSTIMSYAGICASDDIQPHSDPQFHSISFDEIIDYVDNQIPDVGTRVSTGNGIPSVDAGKNYTIPARTPFILTATGTDPNTGDSLTYSWEERDLGPSQGISEGDNGTSPLMRAYAYTTDPTRTVPRLSDLLNNTLSKGEQLPTTNRTLKFRATVRDNRAGGGGVNTDDAVLTVKDTGSAFAVTSPNTNVSWEGFSTQAITWNVAGTTANGINTANVDISLSTDGGLTYPILLASGVPNDGSQDVVIPNLAGTNNRIRIQGSGNIFFDISDAKFTITPATITTDYGDAPDANYGTLSISNGPVHTVSSLFLGGSIDVEVEGQPSVNADGDGLDEDGVVFVNPIVAGTVSMVQVTSSGTGVLDYFFDFDGTGGFGNNPNEVFHANVKAGKQLIPVDVPATSVLSTYARFRLSTTGGLGPKGKSPDGEVEDYKVPISPPPPSTQLGISTVQYVENSPPVFVAPNATVVDVNRSSYPGVTLQISITSGADPQDVLAVVSNGTQPGKINLTASTIQYGGVNIGIWTLDSNVFNATFNASASPESLQALYRQVTFSTPSDSPNIALRTIQFQLNGSFGIVNASRGIKVIALNDTPAIGNAILLVDEDTPVPQGGRIADLYKSTFRDPDANSSMSGLVIVGNPINNAEGSWQYSSDGGKTWVEIDVVDDAAKSLVLSSGSSLGFLPAPNYFGIPRSLEVRALDDSYLGGFSNSVTNKAVYLPTNLRTSDGPVSLAKTQAIARVRNINDPPVATQNEVDILTEQDAFTQYTLPINLFVDTDSTVLTFSVEAAASSVPAWIQFDQETRTLFGTPGNSDVGTYSLLLSATDSSNAKTSIPLTITVDNVNDPPTPILLKNTTIAENLKGAEVGPISSTDIDVGDSITWSVSDGRFQVVNGVLKLRANALVDYEVDRTISLLISATDSGSPPLTTSLNQVIQVIDSNEFFPALESQTFTVNQFGDTTAPIGTLTAVDGDIFQTVRFELLNGPDSKNFVLNSVTGELKFAAGVKLDYLTKPHYEIFVKASDNGSPIKTRTALINVDIQKFNASSPVIPNQTFTTNENPTGRLVIGRIKGSDLDGDALTNFALITSGTPFEVNRASGELQLALGAQLDFETKSQYVLQVSVEDTGTPPRFATGTVTVNIADLNDPPTAVRAVNASIPVNQFGYSVGSLIVTDQDPAPSYSIKTVDPLFEVRNGVLALKQNVMLDPSRAGTTLNVPVTVFDTLDPTSSANLFLRLNVIANAFPWQNRLLPLDSNRDGKVTPADALVIINDINLNGRRTLSSPRTAEELLQPDLDVNGDGIVSPADPLLTINFLNNGSGEGESNVNPAVATDAWLSAFQQVETEWTTDRRKAKR